MLKILNQIVQNGSFILFLLLQLLCVYFIVSYNPDQKKIYIFSHQKFSNNIQAKVNGIADFFSLNKKNKVLSDDIARLLEQKFNPQNSLPEQAIDSSTKANIEKIAVMSARVINNSINKNNNMITINKGSREGVLPNMGVITTNGIVGIVTDTSQNFSLVLSILNSNCKVSSKLSRSGFFGTLLWDAKNPRYAKLEDIQKYADVRQGDTVTTSGYSTIFPGGYPIGLVENYKSEAGTFTYEIEIKLLQDMSTLSTVYIINNPTMLERMNLESKSIKYE